MTLTIGALCAGPGRKTRGSLPADLGTTRVDVPLILVNGSRPGPRVVITGGVHGGEFIPVDAATRLAGLLEPDDVAGQLVICPVANPPAVYGGRLNISPLDGVNINRVFPGDKDGGIDQHLLDFVGYRLTGDDELDAKNKAMAHAVGYERVIFGTSPDGGNSPSPPKTTWRLDQRVSNSSLTPQVRPCDRVLG